MINPTLKSYTYLNLLDVADHLKFKLEQINAPGAVGLVMASKVIQDLTITSKLYPGTYGNQVRVAYVTGGTAGEEAASIISDVVTVVIEDGVSTAAQIKAAIEVNSETHRWVSVVVSGTASNPQSVAAATALTGGIDATGFAPQLYRRIVRYMNDVCDWFEKEIDGPVLSREFIGIYDGANSNVVVPTYWPVTAITGIKIDYNRNFTTQTALNTTQYFLRGAENVKQVSGDVAIKIDGTDVVLRDDNETFVVGRIFSGSVLGSIELRYIAGLGTAETMPGDIYQASLQLLEYWYFQRENRDIAVSSKGVRGESYTKLKGDIPEDITTIAAKYADVSFPSVPVPQRNYFKT